MGYFINRQNIIDNSKRLAPGQFTNRASLPTGAIGYLAYLSDQNDLIVGGESESQAPDTNISWYKFLLKPMDYKNEVILTQGVLGGGGQNVSSNDRNTMQQIIHATDLLIKLTSTLPFTTAYGGAHSSKLAAYYHQGRDALSTVFNGFGVFKHDWATYTGVSSIPNRPNCQGANINTLQPGPVTGNTFGIVLKSSASCYITFSSDTWTSGGYDAPNGTSTGWATYTQNNGYNYAGSGNLFKLTFSNATWSSTGAGGPPNGGGSGKVLNTKWGKFYNGGASIDKYTESSNTWSTVAVAPNGNSISGFQEQSTMMGQDWGYWLGFSDNSSGNAVYYKNTYYHHYATETIARMSFTDISFTTIAGSATQGP
jgi:hypothetical protein